MTEKELASAYDAQWLCATCKASFVVPSLARDCEELHRKSLTSR